MRYDGNPQKILITGLTPGKPYVFAFYNQAWANNSWSAKITSTAVSEELTVNQNQFYGLPNDGQLVECRYIANSTEVLFTVTKVLGVGTFSGLVIARL